MFEDLKIKPEKTIAMKINGVTSFDAFTSDDADHRRRITGYPGTVDTWNWQLTHCGDGDHHGVTLWVPQYHKEHPGFAFVYASIAQGNETEVQARLDRLAAVYKELERAGLKGRFQARDISHRATQFSSLHGEPHDNYRRDTQMLEDFTAAELAEQPSIAINVRDAVENSVYRLAHERSQAGKPRWDQREFNGMQPWELEIGFQIKYGPAQEAEVIGTAVVLHYAAEKFQPAHERRTA
jgi:hypothetical protein